MELTPTQLANLQTITLSSSKVRLDNLAVGQELQAKVISANQNGDITLSISNAILNAKSAIALTEGQLLKLLVAQTGKQIVLQLPEKILQQALSQQLLRESLPKQQPLNHAVQQLQQVLKESKQLNLPPRLTQAMQNFVNRLPTTQQMTNGGSLRDVIKSSGVFLEKSITQAIDGKGKIANNDLKSLLSQLRSSLTAERSNAMQQPQNTNLAKTPAQSTSPTGQQNITQTSPQDLPKVNTSQATIKIGKPISANISSSYLKQTEAQLTTSQNTKVTNKQVEAALNIKASQGAVKNSGLANTSSVTPGISATSTQTLTTALAKSTIPSSPLQYDTNRHATNIKQALALNLAAAPTDTKESGLISRFSNLVDLIDQLIRQVDSSLARTQLHQLNTLQDQESGKLAWSMEVPVKQNDETHLVKLEIEKENKKNQKDAVVTVNLAVDLEHLGPVYSRITLVNSSINVVFWAEKEMTFEMTRSHIGNLETNLEKSGFNTTKINCHHGQPPQVQQNQYELPDSLLDIKV